MNTMLIAALLGLLFVESMSVNRSMKKNAERFSLKYYLRNNVFLLTANAAGTFIMYLMSPAVMLAERYYLNKMVEDVAIAQTVTDAVLAPVTGALIGLMGAFIVRWAVDRGKRFFKKKEPLPTAADADGDDN